MRGEGRAAAARAAAAGAPTRIYVHLLRGNERGPAAGPDARDAGCCTAFTPDKAIEATCPSGPVYLSSRDRTPARTPRAECGVSW